MTFITCYDYILSLPTIIPLFSSRFLLNLNGKICSGQRGGDGATCHEYVRGRGALGRRVAGDSENNESSLGEERYVGYTKGDRLKHGRRTHHQ